MFLLILNNQAATEGARAGLMLWYNNILPLLLPFILISGYIADAAIKDSFTGVSSAYANIKSAVITICLGVFCGYPIGAKCASDFVYSGAMGKKTANIILPLCNNLSPMFLSGYVCSYILENKISFIMLLYLIYLPYFLLITIQLLYSHRLILEQRVPLSELSHRARSPKLNHTNNRIITAIEQITTIGVYVMLCSVILNIIINQTSCSDILKNIIASGTEVSSGILYVSKADGIESNKKIALILSATSFGGISSILQTNCVIKKSGLSIVTYLIKKLICSSTTYHLTLLIL